MQSQGFRSVVTKRYNHKSNYGNIPSYKENILNRNFETTTINQKWVTDITYIYVQSEGWTYLASVMDLYSRKIIGYAYGRNMTAALALEAVKNACLNIKNTTGIILHSDLGSQYTCRLFENYIEEKGFKRFNAEKAAEEVFKRFGISEEEQFQIVENELPSLETI